MSLLWDSDQDIVSHSKVRLLSLDAALSVCLALVLSSFIDDLMHMTHTVLQLFNIFSNAPFWDSIPVHKYICRIMENNVQRIIRLLASPYRVWCQSSQSGLWSVVQSVFH